MAPMANEPHIWEANTQLLRPFASKSVRFRGSVRQGAILWHEISSERGSPESSSLTHCRRHGKGGEKVLQSTLKGSDADGRKR